MRKRQKAGIFIVMLMILTGQFMINVRVAEAYESAPLSNVTEILEDWDYEETAESVILTQYKGTSADIVIPANVAGKQVFLRNSGGAAGAGIFPENTESIVVGEIDRKVKIENGNAAMLFAGLKKLSYLDGRGLDTSDVTTMHRMFFNCENLTRLYVGNWNTGNVTDMSHMFQNCRRLEQLDLDSWDTKNVTGMQNMFRDCSGLTRLDIEGWDTKNVTDMACMFFSCTGLKELDLSSWDTSHIAGNSMEAMFYNCSGLRSLNLSGWDTKNVTSMQNLFFNCSSLETLDLSSWDTGNVTSMNYMFYYCSSLEELNLNGWDTSKVRSILYLFNNCTSLQIFDLSGHDYSGVASGWAVGVFDLVDASLKQPTLIISDDPLIKSLCDEPVIGRVPAGPAYHFGEGTFTDENGVVRSVMKYFDTLLLTDIRELTVSSVVNKYLPVKEGAIFSGWYLDAAFTQPFETAKDIMRLRNLINADLYAKYVYPYDEDQSGDEMDETGGTDETTKGEDTNVTDMPETSDAVETLSAELSDNFMEQAKANLPQTTDTNKVGLFLVLGLASLTLFFAIICIRRTKGHISGTMN